MTLIIAIIATFYVLIALYIWLGLNLKQEFVKDAEIRRGAIVICGRDEEQDLPACLQSIDSQTVSPDRLEIILVDDASSDRTGVLMDEYAARSRYATRVLHMPPPALGEPAGKWRPLKEGIKLASYEGLLLTDADAVLPPIWSQGHLQELEGAEAAAGFALIAGEGLWGKVQALDWLFLLAVGSSLSRWGMPQAALGKNLSVRKSAYDAVGGLEGIGFSLTEDRALVQALVKNGARVSFPISRDLTVTTSGVPNWRKFVQQRLRWASGISCLNWVGLLCVGTMVLRHYLILLGMILGCPIAWAAWGVTALANCLIQLRVTLGLRQTKRLWYFLFWEIFYTCSAPFLGLQFLSRRRVQWKGRKFD